MWTGTNAANVPKEAIVVDDTDTNIRLSSPSLWNSITTMGARYYGQKLLFTTTNGASLSYTFEGVAIW